MLTAMEGLAETAVASMTAAGIQERTGELEENILKSPAITETREMIRGEVKAKGKIDHRGPHLPRLPGNGPRHGLLRAWAAGRAL